jgi:hypothetical protein
MWVGDSLARRVPATMYGILESNVNDPAAAIDKYRTGVVLLADEPIFLRLVDLARKSRVLALNLSPAMVQFATTRAT